MTMHHVVIVGGGFGGLHAAKKLKSAPVQVTLIDRRNFHLFQPLLYQVATGGLSPANIAAPLRSILRRHKNVTTRLEEVTGIDAHNQQLYLQNETIEYDSLILAAGATHSYFGHDDWNQFAPGLKSVEDATAIRANILAAFEQAELESDSATRKQWMTFVIVGAGPTGVELAGAIAELCRHTLKHDFRNINPVDSRIVLIDGQPRVLGSFPEKLSARAESSLKNLAVQFLNNTMVINVDDHSVAVETSQADGNKQQTVLNARTVLWAAGVQAAPLTKQIANATGAETDSAGRILIQPDCSIPNFRNIFVIGDMAHFVDLNGKCLPGVAPVAIQQGKYVSRLISTKLKGKTLNPFRYHDRGKLATIGRRAAVAEIGRFRFAGFFAWLIWIFIHLMQIVQHQNRVLVFFQWAWNYITFNRSARLITGRDQIIDSDQTLI